MKKIFSLLLIIIISQSCSKDEDFITPLLGSWESSGTDENGVTTQTSFIVKENGTIEWTNVLSMNGQEIGKWGYLDLDWEDITDKKDSYHYGKVSTSKTTRVYLIYDARERLDAGYYEQMGQSFPLNYNYHYTVVNFTNDNNTASGYNFCVVETLGTEESVCTSFTDDVLITLNRVGM